MDPASGGPCQGVRNSIPELQKSGDHHEVVSLDSPDAPFLGKDSFKITALGPGKGPLKYSRALIFWLRDHLSGFDAVIIHGLWLFPSYAVNKVIRELKRRNDKVPKVLVMPHGMLDPYFQKAKGRKLKAIRNNIYWALVENKVVNEADALLFTCETELLLARETFKNYHPKRELNIGYGIKEPSPVNDEIFKTLSDNGFEWLNKPYLLFLSRIHPKKGVDLLVQAYIDLIKLNKDLPFLVIAGPGIEHPYGQQLKLLVDGAPELVNRVFFPGMLADDAKWASFYSAEAFILPSHQENFGIAVVEALACSTPVLISNQVNIYKEILKSDAGLVAEDTLDGVKDLLVKWLTLTASEKQVKKTNALNAYLTYFKIEVAATQLKTAIKELIES
ncbi:glycosyltransferase [Mucilaginibacter sp. RS28]|uniref:Glycosyltransferase n=1 Tax=Mucilaginibacter straminoryzae TaxID=2932774 RepID=A0A9X1X7X4_9SPHI|nr:glycosyltransferase [Mucilaginibacter straminoryzae]MCJ8210229.1 glycosyltransferase [Mucilaginibacter straminoryzae]